ncbi:hypothetical protein FOZ61_005451 [Perkinsus olseni]|uniref:THH1/TOM1/TOM3 domain-containing protein n=1 Tax=Perkinsus olseni TaxID=32597 RepID=A0A7J6MCP2_PEROL|nr:hypothetical protein FOZ61_005451 [Perkinsus olseni]KAF4672065.1 hypothetical protein FOL46_009524 [Perkinsus olseni]
MATLPVDQQREVPMNYEDLPLFTPHSAKAAWLAYGDCVLFMIIVILTARQLVKQRREERRGDAAPAVSLTGSRTRKLFLIGLCLSNLARAVSLVVDAIVHNEVREHIWEHSVQGWTNYVLMVFPSLLFLSTYSIVILFWAQVYYAAILVSYPLLRPVCIFFNIAVYGVFLIISVVTFLLKAWHQYSQYIFFIVGFLYIICAVFFFYYGIQVAGQLKDRSRRQRSYGGVSTTEASKNHAVLNRVLVLTLTCPLIFLVRGMLSVLYGVGVLRTYGPASVDRLAWDSLVYCVTEWIPSLLIVVVFWPASRPAGHAGDDDGHQSGYGDQSSSYDSLVSPLLGPHHDEQGNQDIEANRKQMRTEQEDERYNDALKKVVPKLPHANPVGPTKPVTDVPPVGNEEANAASGGRKGRSWSHQLRDVWTGHKEQPGAWKEKK